MTDSNLIGKTLDEKYQIERELGRGGMGTVYLANHLGTERPVAIKVIAPQFMKRPEFVERFRREARAAGRLRHPNVVDVTDFGFAHTDEGQVAYLAMEYLDGCTLGEVLEEEKNLPVGWTLDILEQVCSAVHEAHEQGIIHRDLKPDNIWLEPNQRGGYTVKVLDFGIAKLEAHDESENAGNTEIRIGLATYAAGNSTTFGDLANEGTLHDSVSPTLIGERSTVALSGSPVGSEGETLIQGGGSNGSEAGTKVLDNAPATPQDEASMSTRLVSSGDVPISLADPPTSNDLTRVGAVLGTPLYMSPEQCRGERLDARSDIYSIGVIAYQMLSGDTPFKGDFTKVMESHKLIPPPPLNAKKVRRKLKRVITGALAKHRDERPQTAEAFANSLRSRSEGIFGLLRRAGMIYTEHIQKFLALSTFFFLPMVFLTGVAVTLNFLKATESLSTSVANVAIGLTAFANFFVTAFAVFLITGTITWIVSHSLAVPLRPIRLRPALVEARKKWKTFAALGIVNAIVPILATAMVTAVLGGVLLGIVWILFGLEGAPVIVAAGIAAFVGLAAFLFVSVSLMLSAPVAMMENLRGLAAIRRSKALVSRSLVTALAAYVIMFLIPAVAAGTLSFVISTTARAFELRSPTRVERRQAPAAGEGEQSSQPNEERSYNINFGRGPRVAVSEGGADIRQKLIDTVLETMIQILLLPIQIVVISFTAIIVALLYLKTRQAGGESIHDLFSKFEEADKPRKKWQERVRQRLIQSGRITSRS